MRRHLAQAIAPGTPLYTSDRLTQRRRIKVGRRRGPGRLPQRRRPGRGRGVWLPTALLPRFGVRWSAAAEDRVTAAFTVGEAQVQLELRLDAAGRIVSLAFDRWGDPDGTGSFGWHRFGGQNTGYAGFGGLAIPAQGRLGWDGDEFFRYRLTGLEPSR